MNYLRFLVQYLYNKLKKVSWRSLAKKLAISKTESNIRLSFAVALGIFFSVIPFWGYQTLLAVMLGSFLRLNKFVVILVTNITLGPLAIVSIYGSYSLGAKLLGVEMMQWEKFKAFDMDMIQQLGASYILGAFVLAILLALVTFPVTYFLLRFFRKGDC